MKNSFIISNPILSDIQYQAIENRYQVTVILQTVNAERPLWAADFLLFLIL